MSGRGCAWCGEAFEPGGRGKLRRFCSADHRRAYDQAARDWVRQAVEAGPLTVADLREAYRKACALRGQRSEPSGLLGQRDRPAKPASPLSAVHVDADSFRNGGEPRKDLSQTACNAAQQMQVPQGGTIICNFDRAVAVILNALRFAAGQRSSQFNVLGGDQRKARGGRKNRAPISAEPRPGLTNA